MEIYDVEPEELTSLLNEALVLAAKVGNLAFVHRLLESGVNPNAVDSERRSALMMAVSAPQQGEIELLVIKALLDAGASPNHAPMGSYPLNTVLLREKPSVEVVKSLLAAGANANVNGGRMLAVAVEVHEAAIVRALIDAGADVNAAVPVGSPDHRETPFEVAARKGRADIAQLLVDAGAVIPDCVRDDAFWIEPLQTKDGSINENPVRRIVNADNMRRAIEQVMAHDSGVATARVSTSPSL